jgi:tagatose-1,6-bisphosphate aldolase
LPTGLKTYGHGSGIVVRLPNEVQKRFYSSKRSAVKFNGAASLEHLLVYDDEEKCINAYECIEKIKFSETFDGISNSFLDRLVDELESKYKSKNIRATTIQEAMKILLETIFEPKFSKHSHSFRPGRGCHTAYAEIRD